MNIKIIALTVLLLVTYNVSAQQYHPIIFGVKTGFSFASVRDKFELSKSSSDIKLGYHVGFLVDFELSEDFHLQPELGVSSEGRDDLAFYWIELPIVGKYYFTELVALQFGPSFGYLVDINPNKVDLFNRFNYGLEFGINVDFAPRFFFEARYSAGLADIDKDDAVKSRQNNVVLTIGHYFGK